MNKLTHPFPVARLVLALLLTTTVAAAAAAPPAALGKAGCLVCHAEDKPLLGPSFKDIAARNKGKDTAAVMAQRVRAGSTGVYGKLPMPPTGPDKLSDADLKLVIDYIRKR